MVNGHDTVEPDGEIKHKLVSALSAAGSSTRAAFLFNAKLWGGRPLPFGVEVGET